MDSTWKRDFRNRMEAFAASTQSAGEVVSIKVRVDSGCFHREHSPRAYGIIDEHLRANQSDDWRFEEHESGPELLVWVAAATSTVTLAASVLNLVSTIIKARSDGIARGDSAHAPIELVVRKVVSVEKVREETVLRLFPHDPAEPKQIEVALTDGLTRLATSGSVDEPAPKKRGKKDAKKSTSAVRNRRRSR